MTPTTILEAAIGDIGDWRWWTSEFPEIFQLEFGGVQLWQPSKPGERPPNHVALRFVRPVSVSFVSDVDLPEDWPKKLHDDQLEPFGVREEDIAFDDMARVREILGRATRVETIFGTPPTDLETWPVRLAFLASGAGVVVGAESLAVVTSAGPIPLDEIEDRHRRWWQYWRAYWDVRGQVDAMPIDHLCEITIPLASPTK